LNTKKDRDIYRLKSMFWIGTGTSMRRRWTDCLMESQQFPSWVSDCCLTPTKQLFSYITNSYVFLTISKQDVYFFVHVK
jgi:hypothetical protein